MLSLCSAPAGSLLGLLLLCGSACHFDPSVEGTTGTSAGVDSGTSSNAGDGGAPQVDVPPTAPRYRQEISFQYAPVADDLVNFPVLVVLDAGRVNYDLIQNEGQDLRFIDSNNQTILAHEIEVWNEQGRSYVWVQVPRIAVGGASSIWMSYGDTSALDGQRVTDVWSADFAGVWHLGATVSGDLASAHLDSTSGQHHMDHVGATSVESVSSLGRAQAFDGIDDRLSLPEGAIDVDGKSLTITVRARPTGEPTTWPHVMGAGVGGRLWQIWWTSAQGWCNRFTIDSTLYDNWTSSGSIGSWSSLSSVFDGDAVRLYVDGVQVDSQTVLSQGNKEIQKLNTQIYFGANAGLSGREYEGELDEIRISTKARSSEWLFAEHLSSTDALVTIGPQETL